MRTDLIFREAGYSPAEAVDQSSTSIAARTSPAPKRSISAANGDRYWATADDHTRALTLAQTLAELLLADELAAAGGAPVYVLGSDELPAPETATWTGWTVVDLDLEAYPFLKSAGRWRGRGPAVVLCWFGLACRSGCIRELVGRYLATLIHELAHVAARASIDVPIVPVETPETNDAATAETKLRRAFRERSRRIECPCPETLPTFAGHDLFFLRALVHLVHRSHTLGIDVDLADAFDAEGHGLSALESYAAALGDEPTIFHSLPISEVMRLPVPDALLELYSADVRREQVRNSLLYERQNAMTKTATAEPTTLDSVAAAQAEIVRRRREAYRDVVRRKADGESIGDPVEVATLLDHLGLNSAAIAADVEKLQPRRVLRTVLDAGVAAESDIQKCSLAIDAENTRFAPLWQEYKAKLEELRWAKQKAIDAHLHSQSARAELLRTCTDERRSVYDAALKKTRGLMDESERLKRKIDDAAYNAAGERNKARDFARSGNHPENAALFAKSADNADAYVAGLKLQAESLWKEIAAAQAAEDAAQEAMLQP